MRKAEDICPHLTPSHTKETNYYCQNELSPAGFPCLFKIILEMDGHFQEVMVEFADRWSLTNDEAKTIISDWEESLDF